MIDSFTVADLSELLGVPYITVYHFKRSGKLKGKVVKQNLRFEFQEVARFLKEYPNAAASGSLIYTIDFSEELIDANSPLMFGTLQGAARVNLINWITDTMAVCTRYNKDTGMALKSMYEAESGNQVSLGAIIGAMVFMGYRCKATGDNDFMFNFKYRR